MAFDNNWDSKIYKKESQINQYPYDQIVSSVHRYFKKDKVISKKLKATELGCGTGNNLKFLCEFGFNEVIGIDGSVEAINIAKKFMKKHNQCKLHVDDFNKINIKSNYTDLCIDRGAITHNSKADIKNILKEVYRILKPDGFFISSVFSDYHYAFKESTKTKNFRTAFKNETGIKDGLIASFFSQNEIKEFYNNFKAELISHDIKENIILNQRSAMWFMILKK